VFESGIGNMIPCNFLLPQRASNFLWAVIRLVRQRSAVAFGADCTHVTLDLTPLRCGWRTHSSKQICRRSVGSRLNWPKLGTFRLRKECIYQMGAVSVKRIGYRSATLYEGWNFNSGNYLFTTDTK